MLLSKCYLSFCSWSQRVCPMVEQTNKLGCIMQGKNVKENTIHLTMDWMQEWTEARVKATPMICLNDVYPPSKS